MTDEKTPSLSDLDGATRVDLGDDLLEEKTVMIPGISLGVPEPTPLVDSTPAQVEKSGEETPGSVSDLLESAKILTNEGLIEDAKKTLRQVLIIDSRNAAAHQLLSEIQELELKQLMEGDEVRRPYGRRADPTHLEVDVDAVLRQLDQDLGLGIFSETVKVSAASQLSLFQSPELMDEFCMRLERNLSSASVQDWIDLGIGFLEMEFYTIAIRLFGGACKRLDPEAGHELELKLSATCLLAFSFILADRPFEAAAKIQPILHDVEIKNENKVELYYLMGRTYELMKKFDLSLHFYSQVIAIDPHYRDVDRRIRKKR